jgi:mRNA interferase RelE/StbE
MAYSFDLTIKAQNDFNNLDKTVKIQVQKVIDKVEASENPRTFGEELTGNLNGLWKYRAGKYRIVCDIQDDTLTVLAIAISKRETIYDIADKRAGQYG